MVPADLVNMLRKKSAERVEENEDFADLLRRVEIYVDQKIRKQSRLKRSPSWQDAKSLILRKRKRRAGAADRRCSDFPRELLQQ